MRVIDPGHRYQLDCLDGDPRLPPAAELLTFVKREGPGYPGNVGSHPGTTFQEVLRALIDRARYVQLQTPCPETQLAINLMRTALYLFEARAARRHGRAAPSDMEAVESGLGKCWHCGHVGCLGDCRYGKTLRNSENTT